MMFCRGLTFHFSCAGRRSLTSYPWIQDITPPLFFSFQPNPAEIGGKQFGTQGQLEDLKQLFKEENQSASSGEVLNGDNQALKRNLRKKEKENA